MRLPPQPDLPPDIVLHRCRLDNDGDIGLREAGESLLPAERARSERFLQLRDAERYIRGRGFVRRTLGTMLGCPASRVDLQTPAGGKPVLPGAVLDFNLTHSAGWALLAVSAERPVGVDLELRSGPIRTWDRLLATGRMVFGPAEMEVLAALPDDMRIERFLSFWTAKEARMKLLGHGMRMEPRTIVLRLRDGEPGGFCEDPEPASLCRVETGIPGAICHLAWLPDGLGAGQG